MRSVVLMLSIAFSSAAVAGEQLSPPLSVEGGRALLAQAGVRAGAPPASIGPYRWSLQSVTVKAGRPNEFDIHVRVRSLPMGD